MTKQILAFLCGAAIASAWWSVTVMPRDGHGSQWLLPSLASVGMLLLGVYFFLENWDK